MIGVIKDIKCLVHNSLKLILSGISLISVLFIFNEFDLFMSNY